MTVCKKTCRILTIPINVFITLITEFVHIRVFLVVVFDGAAVVTGVAKVVLINVLLVHIRHQHAVILKRSCISPYRYMKNINVHKLFVMSFKSCCIPYHCLSCMNLCVKDPIPIGVLITGVSHSITIGIFLTRVWHSETIILKRKVN